MTTTGPYGPPAPPPVAPSRSPANRRRLGALAAATFALLVGAYAALSARSGLLGVVLLGLLMVVVLAGLRFTSRLTRADLAAAAAATGLHHVTDQRALLAVLPPDRVADWHRTYLSVSVPGGLQGWYRGSPVTYLLVRLRQTRSSRSRAVVRLDLPVSLPPATAVPLGVREQRVPPAGPPHDRFPARFRVTGADPAAAGWAFGGAVAAALVRFSEAGWTLTVSFDGPVLLVSTSGAAWEAVALLDVAVTVRDAVLATHR